MIVICLRVNVQHTESKRINVGVQVYSGAEVSHTNRCRSVWTVRHYNLVPKCPGAELSWCQSVPRARETRIRVSVRVRYIWYPIFEVITYGGIQMIILLLLICKSDISWTVCNIASS